jgi:predicted Fe-Mo cluster-binding NifX family protein
MARKVLIPLYFNEVAPRFDLAAEVWLGRVEDDGRVSEERTLVLPQASAEGLCQLAITEKIETLVCGAIEEEYYQYLRWKKVEVLDSVIGTYHEVVKALVDGSLRSGAILVSREEGE